MVYSVKPDYVSPSLAHRGFGYPEKTLDFRRLHARGRGEPENRPITGEGRGEPRAGALAEQWNEARGKHEKKRRGGSFERP